MAWNFWHKPLPVIKFGASECPLASSGMLESTPSWQHRGNAVTNDIASPEACGDEYGVI
jgi:hypothetical protein